MKFEVTIGLEIHVHLLTKSKCFCSCPNVFGLPPNTAICPVCTGQPGALPSFNVAVAEMAILVAHAFHCEIHPRSVFARKNYFYPDLPKGYQITQFDHPIATNGAVEIDFQGERRAIPLREIHIEEDAGQLYHDRFERYSAIDYNRSGAPLLEIVTQPAIHSPEEAIIFLKTLRRSLIYLGVTDGNMQEGAFRCDVNISLKSPDSSELGERREIKNMNSFRNIRDALNFEIAWQAAELEQGRKIERATLLWNVEERRTQVLRSKEGVADYRYFPEPDLPPLIVDEERIAELADQVPELPIDRIERFHREWGLPKKDAEVLCSERSLADYFEEVMSVAPSPERAAHWILRDLLDALKRRGESIEECRLLPRELGELLLMLEQRQINHAQSLQIAELLLEEGGTARERRQALGLQLLDDPHLLKQAIDEIVRSHPEEFRRLLAGERKLFGFFMGLIREYTRDRADMKLLAQLLRQRLDEESFSR